MRIEFALGRVEVCGEDLLLVALKQSHFAQSFCREKVGSYLRYEEHLSELTGCTLRRARGKGESVAVPRLFSVWACAINIM